MQTMQPEVYIRKLSAVLPNAPVGNDQMEAVLGMVGGLPSRVRRTILRSNAITSRHYAVDPQTGRATHTNTELAAAAVPKLRHVLSRPNPARPRRDGARLGGKRPAL